MVHVQLEDFVDAQTQTHNSISYKFTQVVFQAMLAGLLMCTSCNLKNKLFGLKNLFEQCVHSQGIGTCDGYMNILHQVCN